jgi:hypothetical protein
MSWPWCSPSVLPLAGLAVYSMMQLSEGERIADRAQIISTARAVSSIIDQRLDDNLKALRALATRFPGLSGDLEDFYGDCAAFAAESDGAILLADTTGRQIFNSKRPLGTSLPRVSGTPEFWQVVANAEPRIGNAFTSPVDGASNFAVLVPIIEDGRTGRGPGHHVSDANAQRCARRPAVAGRLDRWCGRSDRHDLRPT